MKIRNPHTGEEKLTPKGKRKEQAKAELKALKAKKPTKISEVVDRLEKIEEILGI